MAEQLNSADRNVVLDRRLTESFRWLFPKMMEQKQSDGSDMTPYALVARYRSALAKVRKCDEAGIPMEETLWELFSQTAGDGSGLVKFGVAITWGERYGQGDFEPLRQLGVPV